MPYVPTSPRPDPELILAQQRSAEAVREMQELDDYDEMRDEPSAGWNWWLVLLIAGLALLGLVGILYLGLRFFQGP